MLLPANDNVGEDGDGRSYGSNRHSYSYFRNAALNFYQIPKLYKNSRIWPISYENPAIPGCTISDPVVLFFHAPLAEQATPYLFAPPFKSAMTSLRFGLFLWSFSAVCSLRKPSYFSCGST